MSEPIVGRWLVAGTPAGDPYPCRCRGRCSPNWCECAGRVDLLNVPATCCARNGNTPREAAKARHGGDYRPCWCKGDLDRHKVEVRDRTVGLLDPNAHDLEHEDEEAD